MAFIDKLLLKLSPKTVIERSRFFDKEWYREKYGIQSDPAAHYLNEGWLKDFDPSSSFSTKDYLINNPDITGINPLLHYEIYGKNEGRRPFVPKRGNVNDYSAESIDIPYEEYFEEFKNRKVVSFDVFDTLVIRPFVKAEEVFAYLETECGISGFSAARKKAEADARKHLNKEVNIDEIYDHIEEKFKGIKEKEIQSEIMFCHRNPLIAPLYEKAKESGKRIIAVSDMYLPKEIVEKILSASGYEMDEIYVSCDHDKTKGSGKLFAFVSEQEGIGPEEMIHFGDNYISDYSEARNSGISAYLTPKIVDQMLSRDENKSYLSFYRKNDGLSASILLAGISEYLAKNEEDAFFTKIGYTLGGPLTLSYLSFVCAKAKEMGIEKLLFVSRDGFCLKEIYENYFYEEYKIPFDYAYLSRAAIYSGALDNRLTEDLKKILSIAKLYLPGIGVFDEEERNLHEYQKRKTEIDAWSFKQSMNLLEHLKRISEGHKKIGVVDMFSGNYTSQKGASYYLNDKQIVGFYAGNFARSELDHVSFSDRLLGMRDNLPVKMSEFLITSFESPIIGANEKGGPIYETEQSEMRRQRYEQVMKGICSYIDSHKRFFDENGEYLLDSEGWLDLMDAYLKGCSKSDLEALSSVVDSENPVSGSNDKTIGDLIRDYRESGY